MTLLNLNFNMKKTQLMGIIRHTLTFVGGILVTKGLLDEGMANEIIGGILTLIGSIWSVINKNA
jgi:hypothetical protein